MYLVGWLALVRVIKSNAKYNHTVRLFLYLAVSDRRHFEVTEDVSTWCNFSQFEHLNNKKSQLRQWHILAANLRFLLQFLHRFLPMNSIKFVNFDFWWLSCPIFGPVHAIYRNSDPVRVGPWSIPRQDATGFAKSPDGRLGTPLIQNSGFLDGFFHLRLEMILRNNHVQIAAHKAVGAVAIPCTEFAWNVTAMVGSDLSFDAIKKKWSIASQMRAN